jgi:hypothetical protein
MGIDDKLDEMIESRTVGEKKRKKVLKKIESPPTTSSKKIMRSFRLPEVVVKRLEILRDYTGRDYTDLVSEAVNLLFSREATNFDEIDKKYFEKRYGEEVFSLDH